MAKTSEMLEVTTTSLIPYERNAKKHPQDQLEKLKKSIQEFGFISPCLIDRDLRIIAGHGRVEAAKQLGMETVPCVFIEGLTEEQRRAYIIADNRLTELGGWDEDILRWELEALQNADFNVEIIGFDSLTNGPKKDSPEGARERLSDRFIIPPFSILDSRSQAWTTRKRAWKALGIKSEVGRGNDGDTTKEGLIFSSSFRAPGVYEFKNKLEKEQGREIPWPELLETFPEVARQSGTSVFDPVLCELAYRWYSKAGDKVLDPFAGGSVRGIVAALTGRKYTGVDLSERQIKANRDNWTEIDKRQITDGEPATAPTWVVGDSSEIDGIIKDEQFDFMFSCPPYADLEVYSDDPRDISNMNYTDFCAVYSEIIKKSVQKLKRDAFAVFVVGDIRDKNGNYRDFVSYTIKAFKEAGMALYNECILITSTGSVATMVSKQFVSSRKVGKTHQNVLIFKDARGQIATLNLEDPEQEEKEIQASLKDNNGMLPQNHQKVLTFIKGNPKERTNELGPVDTETVETFEVEL